MATTIIAPAVTPTTNISYGQKGEQVKALQTLLNNQGYKIAIDGSFGNETYSALKKAQAKLGIDADGIYGTQTYGAFQKALQAPTTSGNVVTPPIATNTGVAPVTGGFNYDYLKDPLYQNQIRLTQSQIAEQMAARGMKGSTIEQERLAQAMGALGLQYKEQALGQYNIERNLLQEQKQQEYTNALNRTQMMGYVSSNADAAILGLPVGTRTSDEKYKAATLAAKSATGGTNNTPTEQSKNYTTYSKNFQSSFANALDPTATVQWLRQQEGKTLTAEEIFEIVLLTPPTTMGKTAYQILQEIIAKEALGNGAGQQGATPTDLNNYTAAGNPIYKDLATPERGARGFTK